MKIFYSVCTPYILSNSVFSEFFLSAFHISLLIHGMLKFLQGDQFSCVSWQDNWPTHNTAHAVAMRRLIHKPSTYRPEPFLFDHHDAVNRLHCRVCFFRFFIFLAAFNCCMFYPTSAIIMVDCCVCEGTSVLT